MIRQPSCSPPPRARPATVSSSSRVRRLTRGTQDAEALILFASYCANDLSASGLPVLSLAGELDGLSTPEKIADARPLLPANADMVEIAGAAHSSFGDYGLQPGDGTPTISDADMTETITSEIDHFFQTQVAG